MDWTNASPNPCRPPDAPMCAAAIAANAGVCVMGFKFWQYGRGENWAWVSIAFAGLIMAFTWLMICVAGEKPKDEPTVSPAPPEIPMDSDIIPLPNIGQYELATRLPPSPFYDWPPELREQMPLIISRLLEYGRATGAALDFLSRARLARLKHELIRRGIGEDSHKTVVVTDAGRVVLQRLNALPH